MMDELEGKVCRCFTRAIRRGSRALSRLYGCFKQQTANGGTGSADVIVENSDGLVGVAPNGCGDHRVFVIGNEILMRQVCRVVGIDRNGRKGFRRSAGAMATRSS